MTPSPVSPKEAVLHLLAQLPDDVTFEQLQHELYVLEKIAEGLRASARGEVIPREAFGQELELIP